MRKSKWTFQRTKTAATSNTKLLKSYGFDVKRAIQTDKNTSLSYGSEFRSANDLQPLLRHHTNWPAIKELIQNGVSYPLEDISEYDRIRDIEYMLRQGNHKQRCTRKIIYKRSKIPVVHTTPPIVYQTNPRGKHNTAGSRCPTYNRRQQQQNT